MNRKKNITLNREKLRKAIRTKDKALAKESSKALWKQQIKDRIHGLKDDYGKYMSTEILSEVDINLKFRNAEKTTMNYRIPNWQHVKIRKIFQKLDGIKGYQSRHAHSMDNYGLFMVQIPQEWRIEVGITKMMWESDIAIQPDKDIPAFHTKAINERWRNVFIYFDNNIYSDIAENLIPLSIDSGLKKILALSLGKRYPIYENLAFRNTMSSQLIYSNWDKILEFLNSRGY